LVIAGAILEGDTRYDPRPVESLTASKPKADKQTRRNAIVETDARTKPKRKKKARLATKSSRTGRASKTDGSERKSGSGEDHTKKTKKRRAQAKEDAHTKTGHPFVSAVRSGSKEESGESRGTD
jgi:hypothetical protein